MRFKKFTFSLLSPLIGIHYGRNPVSGQRFLHVAPIPFLGLDFEFKPYKNDEYIEMTLYGEKAHGESRGY